MTDRSAVDAIRGYFYQFDLSILALISSTSHDDSVSVECIEDVDIRTASDLTAVQCKYYAKSEYYHSVIKQAVMYMLSHFKEAKAGSRPKVSYAIRGHFASGHEKLDAGIDLEFLKKHFLTHTENCDGKKVTHYHHQELGLDDKELAEFLSLLTVDIKAMKFEEQFHALISRLQTEFACSPFTAEFFYYNNALRVIKELSIGADPASRTITKKRFLERVNTSSILFNEWFVQKRGEKEHWAALRKEYFTELNVSPFERFFLVEIDPLSYVREDLKELIYIISKKWSKTSKRDSPSFCPYLFVQGISASEFLALKKDLHQEGFKFIDGHDYHDADFDASSIARRATHDNGVKIKILNSLDNLRKTVDVITKTRKIYQFHFGESYFDFTNSSVGHVKIQVDKLSDIKGII